MAASVWMKSSYSAMPTLARPLALILPTVTAASEFSFRKVEAEPLRHLLFKEASQRPHAPLLDNPDRCDAYDCRAYLRRNVVEFVAKTRCVRCGRCRVNRRQEPENKENNQAQCGTDIAVAGNGGYRGLHDTFL